MFREYLKDHPLMPLLAKREERISFPRARDRAAWEALPVKTKAEILLEGERQHGQPYPSLAATAFMEFTRTGSRAAYEDPYFKRRQKLIRAVLAASLTHSREYLDDVIDGIWCICEETFWGISAHNINPHPDALPACEQPLPDEENPYIDLFAAQTAACLFFTCYLLEDELNAVTPLIVSRVRAQTERRILKPFMHRDDFWWMGMIRKDMCNWTPWILSNVMAALILWERDDIEMAKGIARALCMLDSYLAIMPADGGCDEGAAYWNMAGGSLLDCLEHLRCLTGGKADFYGDSLVRAIGSFPLRAHIAGEYFWNFADCDAKPLMEGERIARYGERTGNENLAALGAYLQNRAETVFPRDTPEMYRVLCRLFNEVRDLPPVAVQPEPLPHLQVFAGEANGLYAAVKGGHNGENHNHNDVGTFLLYVDGRPAVIDLGNMTYTAQTFGCQRYELMNTRSANHNVPLIDGAEQAVGRKYTARDVRISTDGISMDIAGAYPDTAGIAELNRSASLDANGFTLTDSIRLKTAKDVVWVFMLRDKPVLSPGITAAGDLVLEYERSLVPDYEEIPVTDQRMARNFPGCVYRLTLTAQPSAEHKQCFLMRRRMDHA
jgi:hypothetical protein